MIEARVWQDWFDEVSRLVARFNDEDADDPFAYNETASVSLLCAAAAGCGFLTLAEYAIQKRGQDRRTRLNGRADFWMRAANREWSIEFKQITLGSITPGRLRNKMADADRCAGHLLRYGPEHMMSGLIVPLYYENDRETARRR